MGFYIEELPTELNGITMQDADYLADEFLKDTPCNRMWDAVRALRDFYENVMNDAVEIADRKTEPMTTNLEWLKTLSAEELADWLYDEWLHHLQYRWSSSRGGLIIWLKERKTENNSEIPNNSKERSSE